MRVIDVQADHCVGCRSCEMVCSLRHENECSTSKSRIRILRDEEFGENLISLCMQCAEGYCIEGCPSRALSRQIETGVVSVDPALCTGCGACIATCPLGGLHLAEEKGIAFQCDLCGGEAECVRVCSRGALIVTDADPASRERKFLVRTTADALGERFK